MDVRQTIRNGYANGVPVREIAEQTGLSQKAVSKRAVRDPECPPHGGFLNNGKIVEERSTTMQPQQPSEKELAYYRGLFKKHGLTFEDYPYFWDKETIKGMSLFFRNPDAVKAEKESLEQFFARIAKHAPKYPRTRLKKVTDGHLKLIDLADVHIGKYAVGRDGKTSYDVNLAVERSHQAVEQLLKQSQGFPTEKFLFPIGNDILHVDGGANTTTKGTRQDVNGMWWEAYDAAFAMYVAVLERLAAIAPVEVVYNRSNHDDTLGYPIAKGLQAWFRRTKRITFTITRNDREYVTYGRHMIGLQHGDGAKLKDLPLLMAAEEPKMWGDTLYRHVICHHIHHWKKHQFLMGEDMPGVTVQYMRSPSAADDYHQKHGYVGAPEAIDAFVFHPEYGQPTHLSCVFR